MIRIATRLFLCAFVVATVALADTGQTFGGTNVNGPQWNRPVAGGPNISGSLVRYHKQGFRIGAAATCVINSQQDYDGYIHLYRTSFNPAAQLTNLVNGDDDGDLGIGTSRLENLALTAGEYILVTSGFTAGSVGNFTNTIHCDGAAQPVQGVCNGWSYIGTPSAQTLCLKDRFMIDIVGISSHPTGLGTPVRFGASDTGIFWFYNDQNFEAMVKVIDACSYNNRWWVFAGALTNQSYTIRVFDTFHSGAGIKSYSNTFPTSSPAFTDTNAFATCP